MSTAWSDILFIDRREIDTTNSISNNVDEVHEKRTREYMCSRCLGCFSSRTSLLVHKRTAQYCRCLMTENKVQNK